MLDLPRAWYAKSLRLTTILLLPFSWIFHLCVNIRQKLYRSGILKSYRFPVPVIVIGNITVGGTGKTPFVIWLAKILQAHGYRPAIVSRGYGATKRHTQPHAVSKEERADTVGDEAVLFAANLDCPIIVCVDRAAAVRYLQQQTNCNVVLSDDGLQHYRLQRDIEIVIVDGERQFGNQQLLPAGPLREPMTRLQQADFVVMHTDKMAGQDAIKLVPTAFISLKEPLNKINIIHAEQFFSSTVHAVAGIGHPDRFFNSLKALGLNIIPHAFPDHYHYRYEDLEFNDAFPIIMTEKDAVKCKQFAKNNYWFLAVEIKITNDLEERLLTKIKTIASEVEHVCKESMGKYSCS